MRVGYRFVGGRVTVALALIAAALLGVPSVAHAAVPFPEVPLDGWDTDGKVLAVKVVGDTAYLGGDFSLVRSVDDQTTLVRNNVAAISISTGQILPFVANTNDRVRSIESDGNTVWIGGSFNQVGGTQRSKVAALHPITGALRPFDISPNGAVHGLALIGNRLYAGGYFTNINGTVQERVASLDPVTGQPDAGFQAQADSGVRDLAASATGRLFVAGTFTSIGGDNRKFLAEIDATTGSGVGPGFDEMKAPLLDVDVSPDGTFVFGAVAGLQNRASAWNSFDGERRWYQKAMGDTQAVSYYDGYLYFGFHEGFEGDETVRLLAADPISGELEDFRPSINSFFGVWALDAGPAGLAVGGEFTKVSGIKTKGIALFPGDGTPPDTSAPTTPGDLTAAASQSGAVALTWEASQDNRAVGHYRVYRDGVLVGASGATTYIDGNVADDTVYTYEVQASDLAGNLSPRSNALVVRTWSNLIEGGDIWRHEDSPQSSGSWRSSGFNDSGWDVGSAEFGFGDGDESTLLDAGRTTYYFRKTVTIPSNKTVTAAVLDLIRDDGAVVYVNGVEVMRSNMPSGPITADTRASSTTAGSNESQWHGTSFDPALLVAGTNIVAVEVHQRAPGSSDVSFDLSLSVELVEQIFDDVDPTRPIRLIARTQSETEINLTWDPASDNIGVASYLVFRNNVQIATTGSLSYHDTNLQPGTEYTYKVFAVDGAGNVSPRSRISRATTEVDDERPSRPGNVVTSATANEIVVTWDPATDNVTVDRYVIKSFGAVLGTTTGTSFTMEGLDPETEYHVAVRAVDTSENRSLKVHRWQTTPPVVTTYVPVPLGQQWRFLDDGSDQATTWRARTYDDVAWNQGTGEFGYGDGDETTVVEDGPNNDRHITTYFRTDFDIASAAAVTELELRLVRDDGAVVYLNGVEVYRDNMPSGQIEFDTLAAGGISGSAESEWIVVTIPSGALESGTNVLAIEIHQAHRTSSDVSFNAELVVNP